MVLNKLTQKIKKRMKVKYIKVRQMEWGYLLLKININIKVNGEMVNQMVMVY